jgi:hypothetical protein
MLFGWMMAKWYPEMKGHSFYIRPSFGVGVDNNIIEKISPMLASVGVKFKR